MSSSILLRRVVTVAHPKTSRFLARRPLSSSTTPPPPANASRNWRPFATLSAAAALSLAFYTAGAIYPPIPLSILFPRAAPAPPSDPTSPESIAYTEALEAELQSLPLLQFLRSQAQQEEWYEARPYMNFPEERRVNNLTAGALRGPGKLALPPLIRVKKDESESVAFVHLGRGLCGHDGIVHGGMLATLLDETLARTVSVMNFIIRTFVSATCLSMVLTGVRYRQSRTSPRKSVSQPSSR